MVRIQGMQVCKLEVNCSKGECERQLKNRKYRQVEVGGEECLACLAIKGY